ncbi:hypothetical protein ACFLQI_03165 [Candidatus Undinarchaeota archaeon]
MAVGLFIFLYPTQNGIRLRIAPVRTIMPKTISPVGSTAAIIVFIRSSAKIIVTKFAIVEIGAPCALLFMSYI